MSGGMIGRRRSLMAANPLCPAYRDDAEWLLRPTRFKVLLFHNKACDMAGRHRVGTR
jgi:hypothetical protein